MERRQWTKVIAQSRAVLCKGGNCRKSLYGCCTTRGMQSIISSTQAEEIFNGLFRNINILRVQSHGMEAEIVSTRLTATHNEAGTARGC